jgi:molybdopterin/thiamine biosynthesis adenylyltransferase
VKNALIIGCGGIGSYLTAQVNRLCLKGQIENVLFTVADDDNVEEKNILYQDFDEKDIFKNKAKVLAKRHDFLALEKKIRKAEDLKGFDLIILAVDNTATRKLVYDYCYENKKDYIDLRSTGRGVCYFSSVDDKKEVEDKLGEISEVGNSCQNRSELNAGIIQNGNVIIAAIGSQLVLNWTRGEINPAGKIMRF